MASDEVLGHDAWRESMTDPPIEAMMGAPSFSGCSSVVCVGSVSLIVITTYPWM